jgi:hypothetical protein
MLWSFDVCFFPIAELYRGDGHFREVPEAEVVMPIKKIRDLNPRRRTSRVTIQIDQQRKITQFALEFRLQPDRMEP